MISALIVSFNTREPLRETLGRLARLPDPPDEVVVADNGSGDGTLAMLAAEFPAVRALDLGANLGFGAANNRAAAAARGDRLLLLNSDAWPRSGALTRLAAALDADPRTGLAGPRLVYPDDRPQFHWVPATGVLGEALQKLRNPFEGTRWVHALRWPGGWQTAACVLVNRAAFEAVGGFDERYFLYFEDVDFCVRLRAAGWRLRSVDEAVAVHVKGGSRTGLAEDLAYRRSQLLYYRLHRPAWENRVLRRRLRRRARQLTPELRAGLLDLLESDAAGR